VALSDIRTQIKSVLESVDGIGTVHEYERWSNTWENFLEHFKDSNDRINGWTITRRATPAERRTMPIVTRRHEFVIRGIYGLNDADESELTFQDLVEAIQDAFEDQYNLGGYVENSGPLQVNVVEPRMFGKVLCHYAELTYEAVERCTYS